MKSLLNRTKPLLKIDEFRLKMHFWIKVHGQNPLESFWILTQSIAEFAFYVLEFVGKGDTSAGLRGRPTPVYKIGISYGGDATRRLKAYSNSFGGSGQGRPCEGVTVRFLCGTQHKATSRATFGGFAIDKLERHLKTLKGIFG